MFQGLDELRALCGERGDRRRGWEFVRSLTTALGRPVIEGDGIDANLLGQGEDRIGFRLPAALREAYLLFGRRRDLTAAQDSLVWPQSLRVDSDGCSGFSSGGPVLRVMGRV